MIYMVQGYIFLSIYNFILFRTVELKHTFFKSVVISFVLKTIFDGMLFILAINVEIYSILYFISIFIFSAIVAFIISIIVQSKWFSKLLLKIGIKRTMNQNIWDDIIRPNCWLMVYSNDGKRVHYGQYKYGEENKSEPIIALMHYQVRDMDDNVLCDYTQDDNEIVLLNLKNFERIEIVYVEENSNKIDSLSKWHNTEKAPSPKIVKKISKPTTPHIK